MIEKISVDHADCDSTYAAIVQTREKINEIIDCLNEKEEKSEVRWVKEDSYGIPAAVKEVEVDRAVENGIRFACPKCATWIQVRKEVYEDEKPWTSRPGIVFTDKQQKSLIAEITRLNKEFEATVIVEKTDSGD